MQVAYKQMTSSCDYVTSNWVWNLLWKLVSSPNAWFTHKMDIREDTWFTIFLWWVLLSPGMGGWSIGSVDKVHWVERKRLNKQHFDYDDCVYCPICGGGFLSCVRATAISAPTWHFLSLQGFAPINAYIGFSFSSVSNELNSQSAVLLHTVLPFSPSDVTCTYMKIAFSLPRKTYGFCRGMATKLQEIRKYFSTSARPSLLFSVF